MLERDRQTLKAYRDEIEAAERAEQERRERPIREAEAALQETHRQLRNVYVERLSGHTPDPNPILDPKLNGVHMTPQDADIFNRSQFRQYREQNPDVYLTPQLLDQFGDYWNANAIGLVSVSMLAELISRYREANLLPDPPAQEPESIAEPEPPQPSEPELVDGWDLFSGEPLKWTPRELARLSSTDYRKALRLYKEHLALPNLGPGPLGRNV